MKKLSQAQRDHIEGTSNRATIAQASAEGRAARSGQTWRDAQLELAATLDQAGFYAESRRAAERRRK